ncbi:flagellar basal-body rod protein FlgG [Caenimonas sp. SL110]|uniref:flagellar basal-body rod protein FlgG n=1 Tax=Caenimonas sp. SL110 TaxID=1450524 RepID=UPI0006543490|nr:flagellar basal-body rod protein FlgG [Caenimonas sp. SL110]
MSDALYIAATGMQAQQAGVDVIANNLANVNTTAFKRGRVGFADLMTREAMRVAGAIGASQGAETSVQMQRMGAGVAMTGMGKVFDPGEIKKTDSPLDIAIRGEGFLEVTLADGTHAYTRGGSLKVNRDGVLETQAGHALRPSISIPANAESISIAADGRVTVRLANQASPVDAGQIDLYRFSNASRLEAMGDNLYRASEASGEAIAGRPGEDGAGLFAQGFLEGSNVKMVDEMVNLMLAQRAYEASVKVVQAADEMMGLVNNLRK